MRSSAFPPSAQGEEQIDLAHGNLRVRRGQLRRDVGVSAGRLQVRQERLAAGLEEAVRLVGRQFRRLLGIRQGITALQQRGVLGQGGLGFANGVEHNAVEVSQHTLGRGFGFTDAGAGAVGRYGPGQRRPETPTVGGWVAEITQDADGTDGRADADVRVQLARSDADTGRRGASRRSACRTSGRRLSNATPSPTGTNCAIFGSSVQVAVPAGN